MARTLECAECGKELSGDDDMLVCLDNWLQWEHYTRIGPHAGVYCSEECFARYWMVEDYTVERYFEEVC